MEFQPYDYQRQATEWILDHPRCALLLDMGLGKTVCTLTAISELMFDFCEISKVLVIAPLRVASTVWPEETKKWDHLQGLRVSVAVGSEKARRRAMDADADIYVINRENVPWLLVAYPFDFDMVVIDELSSFKSPTARRFRALRKVIRKARRVVGLTGTPVPNGLLDLWAQIYLIDNGARLGRTVTGYRNEYFTPGWSNGYIVYSYTARRGAADTIRRKISDICISMTKEDYLDMPERVFNTVSVKLPQEARDTYRGMERHYLTRIGDDEITAFSAATVTGKLQQIANGQIYKSDGDYVPLHEAKLDALEDLIAEANGAPVLVFTAYRADLDRIRKRISTARQLQTSEDIAAWNRGEIPVAVAHPASIGHGLNLQQGGHIAIWYGLPWALELYQQANDRLYRQGQKHTVSVYHLAAADTVDEAILEALQKKGDTQKALIDYFKARKAEI